MAKKYSVHEQGELGIKVEISPLGKKAIEYLDRDRDVERAKTALDMVKKELIHEFIKAGQTKIKTEKGTLCYIRQEKENIKVEN